MSTPWWSYRLRCLGHWGRGPAGAAPSGESGGMTMSFDALTIAGILAAALSGAFLIVTAAIQASRGQNPGSKNSGR